MKILIKGGNALIGSTFELFDILIDNDLIVKIGKDIQCEDAKVIDATGKYIAPGFIDIHTHCYPIEPLGLDPDVLGIERWASTIVDAGTAGACNFEDFNKNYIEKCKTRVYSLLNVSNYGLKFKHELDDLSKIDEKAISDIVKKYPDKIVGFKARASQSVVNEMGIKPIEMAANIAHENKKPLMVHIGNYPPHLEDVLNCLDTGDVITHTYHGKAGGILTKDKSAIIDEALSARNRGVLFDIGHGSASFSFEVYKKARSLGFNCDLISSDLHVENYNGPVFNMVEVVNKIINCGEPIEDAINKCTSVPAMHFGLKQLGELKEGNLGDVFIFKIIDCIEEVIDSIGDKLVLNKKIKPECLIVSRGEKSGIYQ